MREHPLRILPVDYNFHLKYITMDNPKEQLKYQLRQMGITDYEWPAPDPKIAKTQPDNSWSWTEWLAFSASIIIPIAGWFYEEIIEAIKQLIWQIKKPPGNYYQEAQLENCGISPQL